LTQAGHEVLGPLGSEQPALDLIDKGEIEAALLDVVLGRSNSLSIAARLVEKGLPFAFLTGLSPRDLPEEFSDHKILAKPIAEADLLQAVSGMMQIGRSPAAP
jgi:hypothetical protein